MRNDVASSATTSRSQALNGKVTVFPFFSREVDNDSRLTNVSAARSGESPSGSRAR
jgi:hypothetical protein